MPHEAVLAELDRRRDAARAMGGEEKLARRRESGQLNAEERLAALVDEGSFYETGLLARSSFSAKAAEKSPRDGKITGFGRIDGLVNNAAIAIRVKHVNAPMEELPVEEWDRVIAVNLRGVFLGMRAAAPALIASGGGAIVATASASAEWAFWSVLSQYKA